jgi:hypothetical protein
MSKYRLIGFDTIEFAKGGNMKRALFVVLCLILVAGATFAEETSDLHQKTTPPINARFEIVQSQLAAKWTFRLDRFTGRVAQLVKTQNDENSWEKMLVRDLPAITAPSRPRFQIFTSGLAARHTFLIDTDTERTWVIVTEKHKQPDGTEYDVNIWQPFVQ